MIDRVQLVIPTQPIPLARSRTRSGRHYLPKRSRAYRELVQAEWLAAGRPSLGAAPFSMSARFYGARANADLDALNTLAYTDDSQLACLAGCHRLPVDGTGARAEVDLWATDRRTTTTTTGSGHASPHTPLHAATRGELHGGCIPWTHMRNRAQRLFFSTDRWEI